MQQLITTIRPIHFTNNINQSFVVTGLTDITITGANFNNGLLTLTNNTGGYNQRYWYTSGDNYITNGYYTGSTLTLKIILGALLL